MGNGAAALGHVFGEALAAHNPVPQSRGGEEEEQAPFAPCPCRIWGLAAAVVSLLDPSSGSGRGGRGGRW